MKKNHWLVRLATLLLAGYTLLAAAMAAGTAGSQSDPLVTMSYLNDTFLTQMLGKVDEKLAARDKELADKLDARIAQDTKALADKYGASAAAGSRGGTAETFAVVTLSQGQTLYGGIGCEVMLRVGTAVCVAGSSPGLIDETAATALDSGAALAQNHLYMATVEGRGVTATAATVKLLVRGGYTVA